MPHAAGYVRSSVLTISTVFGDPEEHALFGSTIQWRDLADTLVAYEADFYKSNPFLTQDSYPAFIEEDKKTFTEGTDRSPAPTGVPVRNYYRDQAGLHPWANGANTLNRTAFVFPEGVALFVRTTGDGNELVYPITCATAHEAAAKQTCGNFVPLVTTKLGGATIDIALAEEGSKLGFNPNSVWNTDLSWVEHAARVVVLSDAQVAAVKGQLETSAKDMGYNLVFIDPNKGDPTQPFISMDDRDYDARVSELLWNAAKAAAPRISDT